MDQKLINSELTHQLSTRKTHQSNLWITENSEKLNNLKN